MEEKSNNLKVNLEYFFKHPIISIKKGIHPILIKQLPSRRNFELRFINEKPKIDGPVLALVTHSNAHDIPITCEILEEHCYILIAKQQLKLLDKVFLALNGNIKTDRDDKKSGPITSKKIVNRLKAGVDVAMYPGKTWEYKPSSPTNHYYWGWFDIAKDADATVLPIVLEYYEYTDNCCYVNFGKPFKVTDSDIKEQRHEQLEEEVVTLKEEIWNQFPQQKRKDIPRNLGNAIIALRHRETGASISKIEKEKEYAIGRQNDPDYVFNSPEFKIAQKKLNKIYQK